MYKSIDIDDRANSEKFVQSLEDLIIQIKQITLEDMDKVALSSIEFGLLDGHVKQLECFIFEHSHLNQQQILATFSDQSITVLNHAYCLWETLLEKQFVSKLFLNKQYSFSSYHLLHRFERLIVNELAMLDKSKLDNVLFIGSGPFPVSALWIHKLQKVTIDCLDIDEEAARVSTEVIKRLRLSDHLRVIHNPSSEYDVSSYDAIFIALLAKPKLDILANLAKSIKPDCQIICRTSVGLRALLYEPTATSEIEVGFKIKDKCIVNGNSSDTISSFLLVKE